MDQAARCAFIHAQTVCAMAEIEGMRAANSIAMWNLTNPPYKKEDFEAVPVRYGIDHNSVIQYLRDG